MKGKSKAFASPEKPRPRTHQGREHAASLRRVVRPRFGVFEERRRRISGRSLPPLLVPPTSHHRVGRIRAGRKMRAFAGPLGDG